MEEAKKTTDQELLELVDGLEVLVTNVAKAHGTDGKYGPEDLVYVIEMLKNVDVIIKGGEGVTNIKLDEITQEGAMQLTLKIIDLYKKVAEILGK